jgi:small subunit ribosomal protein S16
MAVVLRLQRTGKPNMAFYRVVAIDKRRGPHGEPLEILGNYDPRGAKTKEKVNLKDERVEHWLKVGAKPSPTVGSLIKAFRKTKVGAEAPKAAAPKAKA